MNKRQRFASICFVALCGLLITCCVSCRDKNASQGEAAGTEAAEADEIYEFPCLMVADTVKVGGRVYDYKLQREPSADLPVVHNEMSGDTRDNTITLTLSRGGEQLFHHTFTKESFKSETPEDIYPTAVLQEAGVMPDQPGIRPCFWFSLGEPNADLVTFVVTVSPDGTFTYQPDFIDYVPEEGE